MPRPKKGEPNKSEFIRKHAELPVAAILAKAKAAGMTITPGLIYNVKGRLTAKAPTKATTKPSKKSAGKKAAFIKANAGLAAADLAAKAEKQGVDIVVVPPEAGTGAGNPSAKKAGAKKRGPTPKNGKVSASEFVRSLPASTPAKDVVARGAEQGLTFSANLVYAVRSKAGAKKAVKPTAEEAPRKAGRRTTSPVAGGSPEAILSRLVVEWGIGRVRELLAAVEKRIEKVLAGA